MDDQTMLLMKLIVLVGMVVSTIAGWAFGYLTCRFGQVEKKIDALKEE